MAIRKNIEIEFSDSEPVEVNGIAELFHILLRNVIDNAIRYSPGGSVIWVKIIPTNNGAELSVIDQGLGLSDEERNKVWQRFYRIQGSGEIGSGLGLSIVKRIAEIHRAKVKLFAGFEDKGLRVTVTFNFSFRDINFKNF